MDLLSIVFLLALSMLVAIYISRPFFDNTRRYKKTALEFTEQERSSLLAEHDRILNSLNELDFDHALGKIPKDDYPQQRLDLVEQGAEILRKLDAMQELTPMESRQEQISADFRTGIAGKETIGLVDPISNSKQKTRHAIPTEPNDELEALLAQRRRSRQQKASGFCPKCGIPLAKSDRFCPKCGLKLEL